MALFANKGVVNKTTSWYLFDYCFVLTGRRIVYSNIRVLVVAPIWKRQGEET